MTALTTARPDLVLFDKSAKSHKVFLVELTMTWDTVANTDAASSRKHVRYENPTLDIRNNGMLTRKCGLLCSYQI